MDYSNVMDPMLIFSIGFLVITLASGYYLLKKNRLASGD